MLYKSTFSTSRGFMIAIADNEALYLLEFVTRKGLNEEIERLCFRTKRDIVSGRTTITDRIEQELNLYFAGSLTAFTTRVAFVGTPFQQKVWHALQTIPFGKTISYKELAQQVGNPTSSRAVARANATNQLALIVPCHRVIASNGLLGGYAAGVQLKQDLLRHEAYVQG